MSDVQDYLKSITVEKVIHEIAEFVIYGNAYKLLEQIIIEKWLEEHG